MKYKRQLMGSLFAAALFVGGYPGVQVEDFVPNSKVNQYLKQVHMKSGESGINGGENLGREKKKL